MEHPLLPLLPSRVARSYLASMPRSACIVAAGTFGKSYCLLKNRDRNYVPKLKLVHELRDGMEVAYIKDEKTGWIEGLNGNGVGVVNAALMVSRDESERDEVERTGKKLLDGDRILKALQEPTVSAAAKVVRTYKDGLRGHTIISDGKKTLYVEMPDSNDVEYDEVPTDEIFVRTNHGIEFPDAGYVEGPREESSKSRQAEAEEVLADVESPDDVAPALLKARDDRWEPTEMVRDNRSKKRMRTTSQMVVDLTQKRLLLYLFPDRVEYSGLDDRLPKDYDPEITVEVREYTDLSEDTAAETKAVSKKVGSLLPIMNPAFNLREVFKQLVLLEDHLFHERKRCPDCIWKHLLTAEALAEEAVTLDVSQEHAIIPGLAEEIRGLQREIRAGVDLTKVAQKARVIRKKLLGVASMMRVAKEVVLDDSLVEQFRRDVLQLAKAAEGARDLDDVLKVRKAVYSWLEKYERFGASIREDLEGRIREAETYERTGIRPTKRPLSDKSWADWYLKNMTPYWALNTELQAVPQSPGLKSEYGGPYEDPEDIRARLIDFYFKKYGDKVRAEEEVDAYFSHRPVWTMEQAEAAAMKVWAEKAGAWARRLRARGRDAWKYLIDLVKWTHRPSYSGGGEEAVKVAVPDREVVNLDGFRLVFQGYEDAGDSQEYLPALRAGLKKYRQRASQVLPLLMQKQLPMVVEWTFDPRRGGDAATYEQSYIRITPWLLTNDVDKFVEAAAHEMGHHVFKTMLSDSDRKFWHTAVQGSYGDLDLREALKVMEDLGPHTSVIDDALAGRDPVLFLQLGTLLHDISYKYKDLWDVRSIRKYLEGGGDPIIRVPRHPITGYAGKNTEEAFCEAVGRLVAYGPLVLPTEVRGWLRVVLPKIRIGGIVEVASSRDFPVGGVRSRSYPGSCACGSPHAGRSFVAAETPIQNSAEFPSFEVGDFITYGKFQNKPGQIVRMFVNEQGIPSIEVAAVGHARRKNRIMGLFRIRHMDMAKRVAARWAGSLIQFPTRVAPVRPKHTVVIGGKKYVLSADGGPLGDQLEALSGGDGGGAQVVDMPAFMKPEPYRFLWAYNTEDGSVAMWRVTDGNSKVWGSADTLAVKIVELDRKGELNRVTSAEMAKLDRAMRKKEHEQLQSMKKWLAENATEYQKMVDQVAWDVFDRDIKPTLVRRLREVARGVVPFGFKVKENLLDWSPEEEQLRVHVLTQEMKEYTVEKIEAEIRSRGYDPDAPGHDIQAAYWAKGDVEQAVWAKFKRSPRLAATRLRLAGTWGVMPWEGDSPLDAEIEVLGALNKLPAYQVLRDNLAAVKLDNGDLNNLWAWVGTVYLVSDALGGVPVDVVAMACDILRDLPQHPMYLEFVNDWKHPAEFEEALRLYTRDLTDALKGERDGICNIRKVDLSVLRRRLGSASFRLTAALSMLREQVEKSVTSSEDRVLNLLVRPLLRLRQQGNPLEADRWGEVDGRVVGGNNFEYYEALKDSIERHGVRQPVELAWFGGPRPQIVEGHHRLSAAWEAGLKIIPVRVSRTVSDETILKLGLLPSPPTHRRGRVMMDEVRRRVVAKYQSKKVVKTKDGDEATVYIYSERQVQHRNREKAKQVEKLHHSIDDLRTQVKKDLEGGL